jgi:hypothetical protein
MAPLKMAPGKWKGKSAADLSLPRGAKNRDCYPGRLGQRDEVREAVSKSLYA